MLRPLHWRDLPILYRYRHGGLFLDSALAVTQGSLLAGVWFTRLIASGCVTWVDYPENGSSPLLGQCFRPRGKRAARLAFLAPHEALSSSSPMRLIEQLVQDAGQIGAHHLLAELDAASPVVDALRQVGFSPCARQRIWAWERRAPRTTSASWRMAHYRDLAGIQTLFRQVVPEAIAHIEELEGSPLLGLVYAPENIVQGYAEVKYGWRGIWVKPYLSSDISSKETVMQELLASVPQSRPRTLYVCARAYQPGVEPALENLGATPGPEQVVMLKRLAVHQKARELFRLRHLEGHPEA